MKSKRSYFLMFVGLFVYSALASWAATEPIAEGPGQAEEKALELSNLAISESIGKIETRRDAKSSRWVVHIQDVHAHFAAQENIAAILDQLNATYGIKTVAVEGSWHSTSLPKSWAIPNSPEKQMLARALLEDHYLTGPGYAALFSQMPMTLIGMEEGKLYEENRKIYLEHLFQREEIVKKVDALDQEIARLKGRLFNPDLLNFDQALLEFRKGKKAEKFLPSLISKTEALGIDISPFAQIVLLKSTLGVEKSLNKEKLKAEGSRLVQAYKSKRLSFEELLRSGKVPAEKLQFYPELQKYLKLIQLQDQISHRPLFSELDQVIALVKEKLMTREEEKALDQRSERFELAKKIILFQATPDDFKLYQNWAQALDSEIEKAGLGEALKLGLNFYEIAKQRDTVFFKKITNDPKLNQNIAVVAGGFHTEGLSQQLEEAGISYLVITPDLAGEAPNEAVYFEKLKIGPVGTQTLALFLSYILSLDLHFPAAVEAFQKNRNLTEAKQIVERGTLLQQVAAPPVTAGAASAFDLEKLTPEEQMGFVQDVRNLQKEGKQTVVYVVEAQRLNKIFRGNPWAVALFTHEIFSNENNLLVLPFNQGDEIPDETVGLKNVRTRYGETLESIVEQEVKKGRLVAVLGDYPKFELLGKVLRTPFNEKRVATVALVRAVFSMDPRFNPEAFTPRGLDSFETRFREAYQRLGLFAKAA